MKFDPETNDLLARMEARLAAMPVPTPEEVAAELEQKRAAIEAKNAEGRRRNLRELGWDARPLDVAASPDYDEHRVAAYLHALNAIDPREGGIVVLAGSPGSGKTAATARWATTRKGGTPRFIRAAEFFRSSRYDEERSRILKAYSLVMDDAGAEYADVNGNYRVDLDELIDRFYADKRILVITTNMDAKAFGERYGARVVDRLRECGRWVGSSSASMRRRAP